MFLQYGALDSALLLSKELGGQLSSLSISSSLFVDFETCTILLTLENVNKDIYKTNRE